MKLVLAVAAICTVCATGMSGQSPSPSGSIRPVFSTIPFWPPDGSPPADLADKFFVYLDYAAQEYVVSYPGHLSGDESTGRVQFRVEAQFTVIPDVSVSITNMPNGILAYRYTVVNAAGAKRPLREFGIVTATDDDSISLSHPSWSKRLAPVPAPVGPGVERSHGPVFRVQARTGRLVSWLSETSAPIAPSGAGTGFQITSRFLPGITPALGSSGITSALPRADLPPEVQSQLAAVLSPEKNWAHTITIGPKFNPDEGPSKDPVWIANDFLLGLEKLVVDGQLAKDSPFIVELNSFLDSVRQGGLRIPFRVRNEPKGRLEAEIGAAARIALSSE
jgi:hypothetical protein